MKGWSVVLVAAFLVVRALDGYFLWQERLYRGPYDHVRTLDKDQVDFSMNVTPFRTGYRRSWLGATLSRTLMFFYGALVVTVGIASATLARQETWRRTRVLRILTPHRNPRAVDSPYSIVIKSTPRNSGAAHLLTFIGNSPIKNRNSRLR